MDIQELQRNWERFGKDDPLWRILSIPGKQGRWTPEEFFQTGREEVQEVLAFVEGLGLKPAHRRALDFGCGVGRLSQALAEHFDRVVGVDISGSMVEQARRLNTKGDRLEFKVNGRPDLSILESGTFDFIYSNITLQHVSPRYTRSYLRDFVRVLAPGGVLVFQLPTKRRFVPTKTLFGTGRRLFEILTPQSVLYGYHRARYHEAPFGLMYGAPSRTVVRLLSDAGAEVVKVAPSEGGQWTNCRYAVRRPAGAGN